jgi:hypothetical protein
LQIREVVGRPFPVPEARGLQGLVLVIVIWLAGRLVLSAALLPGYGTGVFIRARKWCRGRLADVSVVIAVTVADRAIRPPG